MLARIKPLFVKILATITSGILACMGFPGFHFPNLAIGWVAPFALIPLFLAVFWNRFSLNRRRCCFPSTFFYFWLFGFVFQLFCFFWISKPIIYFSSLSPFVAYPLYVFICTLTALYFPVLFSPILWMLWQKPKPTPFLQGFFKTGIFAVALQITLMEIIIPRFFEWSFAELMSSETYVNQLSSVFGFNTASFFIFFTNLTLAYGIYNYKKKGLPKTLVLNACLWIAILAYGAYRTHQFHMLFQTEETTRIAFVQPNFNFDGLSKNPLPTVPFQRQSLERIIEMSQNAVDAALQKDGKKPDLIVWPESGAPDFFLVSADKIQTLAHFSQQVGIAVLVQASQWHAGDIQKMGFENAPLWSASILVDQNGVQGKGFQKWIPMPFGEIVPLEKIFPSLGNWYRSVFTNASKLEAGTNYQALAYGANKFVAPLICFDSIFQKLPYLQTKYGNASLFVNQANFLWMVDSNAGLEFSVLDQSRALENARSLVIVSNTGPTMAFNPVGEAIFPPTTLLTQQTGFVDVPLYKGFTLFSWVGRWPLVALGILSFIYVFLSRRTVIF